MPSAFPWRSGASTLAGSVTLTPGSDLPKGSQGHDSTTTAVLMDELPQPVTAGPRSTTSKSKKSVVQVVDGPGKTLRVHWARLRQRISPDMSPSNTSEPEASQELHDNTTNGHQPTAQEKFGPVDAIVVDRSWFHDVQSSAPSQSDGDHTRTLTHSGSIQHTVLTTNDHESIPTSTFWTSSWLLTRLRYHLWPAIFGFFCLRFTDKDAEKHYMKEHWFMSKARAHLAVSCSILSASGLACSPFTPQYLVTYCTESLLAEMPRALPAAAYTDACFALHVPVGCPADLPIADVVPVVIALPHPAFGPHGRDSIWSCHAT